MAGLLHVGLNNQPLLRATLEGWLPGVRVPNLSEPDLILAAAEYFRSGSFTIPQRGRTGARLWFALHAALFPGAPPVERITSEQPALFDLVNAVFVRAANASLAAPHRTHNKNTLLRILSSLPKP